ncbi:MAG: hypothetical protein WEB60_07720 [Terrimicrobiaceae bacterium]
MTTLIIFLFRLGVFAVLTFGFVVLYEHGPSGFVSGAPTEWHRLTTFVEKAGSQPEQPPAESDLIIEPALPES